VLAHPDAAEQGSAKRRSSWSTPA